MTITCVYAHNNSQYLFQETLERQLCDPRVLTPDFSKPEVRENYEACILQRGELCDI